MQDGKGIAKVSTRALVTTREFGKDINKTAMKAVTSTIPLATTAKRTRLSISVTIRASSRMRAKARSNAIAPALKKTAA